MHVCEDPQEKGMALRGTLRSCLRSPTQIKGTQGSLPQPEKDLKSPLYSRISNQSILKEISPEYSLEGLMLKLKLQYIGHLMPRTDSLEKTLMLRKIEGERRRRKQRMRWLDGITDSMHMSLSNAQAGPSLCVVQALASVSPPSFPSLFSHD